MNPKSRRLSWLNIYIVNMALAGLCGFLLFLLIWLAAGLLPAALAVGGPNHLRSVASLPATYLMIGVAGVEAMAIICC